ncbi:putative nucleotidyltransferase, ribonuclease H [Tanacetum coccineum]
MNERFFTVLLNKLPSKEKDLGSFTIPCDIGQLHIDNALADLGASISLMSYTMYEKLGLGEPKATRMSLELADRPLLETARAMIDVFNKKITLRVGDDEVIFDVDQSIKRPTTEDDECYGIDDLDDTINEKAQELLANEELDSFLSRGLEKIIDQSDLEYYQEKTTFTCPYRTFAYQRMPFGLCNAPATFQRCMTAIFHDMVEDFMEVFMDDFSVFGNSFYCCLANLDRMLFRCEETNLVLNWEKCHFMVKEGIVLGHKISSAGIEVDRAKIDVIAKLPYPTNVKGVRSFLGHAGFYQRFIKDFSMIYKPMTQLLMKDAKFNFFDDCKKAFNILKEKLTTSPIIISPDWNVPFELMCDASDFAVGSVLGQRIDGKFKPIYYNSKILNNAQEHYTTTKKELLAVVFSFDKFQNLAADHLSRLENPDLGTFTEEEITDEFLNEQLMILKAELNSDEPWYADYLCSDNVMRRCVAGNEIHEILAHCHSGPTEGYHSASITGRKVYESGFYWPSIFKDAKDYVMRCDACQRSRNISSRSEMPQNNI